MNQEIQLDANTAAVLGDLRARFFPFCVNPLELSNPAIIRAFRPTLATTRPWRRCQSRRSIGLLVSPVARFTVRPGSAPGLHAVFTTESVLCQKSRPPRNPGYLLAWRGSHLAQGNRSDPEQLRRRRGALVRRRHHSGWLASTACGDVSFTARRNRHYFISTCVMSGIDFMTIARWVGHKDGGVLIGKVYGHLSNEHARRQAERVNFQQETPDENEISKG